jgi:hypothetical protein
MPTDRPSGEVVADVASLAAGVPDAGGQTGRERWESADERARGGPRPDPSGPVAARKFIGRVSRLDVESVRGIVATWRDSMRHGAEAWLAAEGAVGLAVVSSGRHREQKPLLVHVADAFAHLVWYGGTSEPELRVQATEASGQYLATVAMLAVLVRDHIDAATFDLIYRPFAAYIPPSNLERE